MKRRDELPDAFAPIIAESIAQAYTAASKEVQGKLRRVVQVWRDRAVFEAATIDGIEARLADVDKSRTAAPRRALGGDLFSPPPPVAASNRSSAPPSNVPRELASLASLHADAEDAASSAAKASNLASTSFTSLPATAPPASSGTLPAHSGALSRTLRDLDAAASAVQASISARESLASELRRLLERQDGEIRRAKATAADVKSKRDTAAQRRADAEEAIFRAGGAAAMRATAGTGAGAGAGAENGSAGSADEPARPEVEALTPPELEAFTPPGEDPAGDGDSTVVAGDGARTPPGEPSPFARSILGSAPPGLSLGGAVSPTPEPQPQAQSRDPRRRAVPGGGLTTSPAKRRRVESAEEGYGEALEVVDADVVGMI